MVGSEVFQINFDFELCPLTLLAVKVRYAGEWI